MLANEKILPSIDITREKTLDFRKVPSFIEKIRGHRPHISAVYRWAESNRNGVALEYLQTPKGRITSEEAIQRFFNALTHRCTISLGSHARQQLPRPTADPLPKRRVAAKLGITLDGEAPG